MSIHTISAVVLAGGRGSRMQGEDKGLTDVAGRPLIRYVLDK
ncbi:MAG: NTP transferase domain-containing protein, partial [Gammaproteobacteria bacterium]|nr:NTP transferase domain-containing protein [Gammaproteobacteria bacterium]